MVNEQQVAALDPEAMDQFAALVSETAAMQGIDINALSARDRDLSVQPGETLAEGQVGPLRVRFRKGDGKVRYGDMLLPDRITLYDRRNEPSLIPTTLVPRRLSTRDEQGRLAWSRQPFPDVPQPEYIYKEVPTVSGQTMRRRFSSEADYELFMQLKHPSTWANMQRRAEAAERAEDRAANRQLAEAILAAVQGSESAPVIKRGRKPAVQEDLEIETDD